MDRIALIIGGKIYSQMLQYENVEIYDSVTFTEAAEIAVRLERKNRVDIIISPAGTAAELQKHVNVPIVKTNISDFDIFDTLINAERESGLEGGTMGLVMFESKDIAVDRFRPFLKNRLISRNYKDEDHLKKVVSEMVEAGVWVIVGGPTTVRLARQYGIKSYILRLSDESLTVSINKAKESLLVSHRYKKQNQMFKTAISLFMAGIIIVDNNGCVTEYNKEAADLLEVGIMEIAGKHIEDLTNDATIKAVYKTGLEQHDKIVKYREKNLFSTRLPIIVDGVVNGAVITVHDAGKISKMEHKFRKYQSKGFVAQHYFKDIRGDSSAIRKTIEIAKAFGEVNSDILLTGETGTGKELFAQSIHNVSNRRKGPFVAINCAAFPENLLESELMGYEEGAFTGAKKGGKEGLFELAHMGTIFLDEINQLPIQLQGRILRVLQERQVLRLGGSRVIPINVRVIAATNENLGAMIDKGLFRKDLYYRISVLNLNIPPLRDRKGDVTLLTKYYFQMFSNMYREAQPFDDESLRLLEAHRWPGNIRELVNCIERYVVISRQLSISPSEYVKSYIYDENEGLRAGSAAEFNRITVEMSTLRDMEKQLLDAVIRRFGNNKRQAALALGISRTTLWKKCGGGEQQEY